VGIFFFFFLTKSFVGLYSMRRLTTHWKKSFRQH